MTVSESPIAFWGLLALLALAGLAFVLPPLLRRGTAGADPGCGRHGGAPSGPGAEGGDSGAAAGGGPGSPGGTVDRRGRWLGYALAVLLPALAGGLYLLFGAPEALTALSAGAQSPVGSGASAPLADSVAQSDDALQARLPMLEARVREAPDDGEAWGLLARAYSSLGRYEDAAPAFAEASRRLPAEARLWSGYAEALAIKRGHVIEGEPYQLALKAVEIDMNDPKGLELLGIYHFQQGSYGQASFYWRRLAKLLPPETDFARDIAEAAAEATARARAASDASAESGLDAAPATAPRP